jgi:phosphomannomutase
MKAFLFDVDGTLTVSRQAIDKRFSVQFKKFAQNNDVFLVTGSDKPKTIEQIGKVIYDTCKRAYQCSGNDVWEQDKNINTNSWTLPLEPHQWLMDRVTNSPFSIRTGTHIEERPGMVNFSVLGRGANTEQRQAYVDYDSLNSERNAIARAFNENFGKKYLIEAHIGGETGLDISVIGADKAQVLDSLDGYDEFIFFGDKTMPGGNDFSLADRIIKQQHGRVHQVYEWQETQQLITDLY